MAERTVSVDLQLKAAQFVAGAKEAEAATDKLDKKLEDIGQHDKDFAEAEKSALGLAGALKEPTAAADKLADKVDVAGTQMKETAVDARFLADELKKARTAALEAAAAFALTGDKAKLTEFRKQTTYANQLGRIDKALQPAEAATADAARAASQVGAQVGATMAKSAGGAFSEGLSGVLTNPYVLAALTPAAVELGAGIGGVLLLGIGLAGIGAGIAGQIKNPQVAAAAGQLADVVGAGFQHATASFGGPLTDVIKAATAEWHKLELGVQTTFEDLAPEVTMLGAGLLGFVDQLVPGLERAAVAARPLIDTFSAQLPEIGAEFASLLSTMADNTDTLNEGLGLVLGTLKVIIKTLDIGVTVGSKLFEVAKATTATVGVVTSLGQSGKVAQLDISAMAASTDAAGNTAAKAAPDFDLLAQSLSKTAMTADDVAGAMTDKVVNALLSADHATLSLAESQTRLSETLKQNKHAFDIHSKAGQANREAILSVVQANLAQYDSMIKSGYSAQEAAAAYDKNTAALEKQLQKAHFTKDQIQQLIGQYKKVPDKVDTEIAAHGLADAIDRLGFLLAKLNGLDGSTFGFFIHGYTEVDPIASHHDYKAQGGQLPHAAEGAFYPAHGAGIVIAEDQTHGEWMIPQAGITQSRAYDLGSAAMAPHGLAVSRPGPAPAPAGGTLRITLSGGDAATRAHIAGLRAYVQSSYGGNVQLALGQ
jgi:hypothetical protein